MFTTLTYMLQLKDLRGGQEEEPCIEFTQENLIEDSIQNCLSYILKSHGLCNYYFSLL